MMLTYATKLFEKNAESPIFRFKYLLPYHNMK
jgi:hypothetical protein